MMDFENFDGQAIASPLSQTEKAAAVLLAMGKSVAGKLLKFFTQSELQAIIAAAQSLRAIPPHELESLVNEFEDLFTEGAGLMDNAKAMESILEEGLTPDEVDGLLGRRATFQSYEASIWDRLQDCDPVVVAESLAKEHPQTIAYVLSMMPSNFGAKVLIRLSDRQRPDILKRAVNIKNVSPKAAGIIEERVIEMIEEMEAERNAPGPAKIAEVMNELEKKQVDSLLASLETLSTDSAKKVRPKIFLFDDILYMPQRSRVQLFNDVSTDVITMALRGSGPELRESILASIGARQRRMIEADLAAGDGGINPRDIAIARRSIAQEAIRLAASGQLELKEKEAEAA
ncbi:flagellar motor switch protein FliG [Sinorhizobium kostiense]|uniref:Flagellar motor switch protein FliG n=1 Tax=Sinorhizobium kostiense TaxID=76747 RepID=A0ABS4QYW5_9HYPH|nr:flagellar motor switch protein FliG [Sinorhizobium kostiense]MBP2235654.1 flagellar motor switch protein FliG [Sinorhizobium kostiense]